MPEDDETRRPPYSQAHMRFERQSDTDRVRHPEDTVLGASGVLFEQAMAQTRMAVCLADPRQKDMPIVFVNRAFCTLTGYDEDEVVGRNCRFLQGPGTDPGMVKHIRGALDSQDVTVVELLNYRKNGEAFWNALHLGPIFDQDGELLYYFGSQWDVTDVHAARADERHARMLARELSHRMKNMFAVIGGLVTITGRTRGIRKEAAEINERIRALGRAFETTLDDSVKGSTDLDAAVRAVLDPYDPDTSRITIEGGELRVDSALVSVVGIVLHELATNAIKHGSLSGETGTVTVEWQSDDDVLKIAWRESGGPSVPDTARDAGAGMGIIDTLLSTIGGDISTDWRESGIDTRITVPMRTRR